MLSGAATAGSLLLAVAAAAGPAPPPADIPIRIDRCAVLSRTELRDPFNALPAEYVSGLVVRFVNVRATPATLIRLDIRYQGASDTIVEHGMFATNVSIDRTYSSFAGERSGGDAPACAVSSVTYGDGTIWGSER